MNVTFACHIIAHQSCRTDVHLVKVAVAVIGEIRTEDLLQFRRGMHIDIFRRVRSGIGFDIDLPQIFVQLGESELERRFHRIGIHGRQLAVGNVPRHIELPAEHRFRQLQQDFVLGRKQILKAAPRYARFFHNLGNGSVLIPLLQKQPDAYGEDLLFCFDSVFPHENASHPPVYNNMHINYTRRYAFCQPVRRRYLRNNERFCIAPCEQKVTATAFLQPPFAMYFLLIRMKSADKPLIFR